MTLFINCCTFARTTLLSQPRHQLVSASRKLDKLHNRTSRTTNPGRVRYSSTNLFGGHRYFPSLVHSQVHSYRKALVPSSHLVRTYRTSSSTSTSRIVLESGSSTWITALLVASLTGLLAYVLVPPQSQALPESASEPAFHSTDSSRTDFSSMTAETLPGRPGTLTPAEEEKLREFWIAVLQVFGVLEQRKTETEVVDTPLADAPKKKKLGLFHRKEKSGIDSPKSPASAADGEDKYGQTKEYHEALANQSPESLRTAFWSMVKHDHPDALLLRFLRARKWDVEKALVMMVSTMRWRSTEMHVDDDIMKNGDAGAFEDLQGSDPAKKKLAEDFITQMRMGKSFLHGLDKDDRPMCFVRARLHKAGEQSEESLERYTVYVIETARMILSPPVDTACIIFDLSGFSLANMDYAPVKFMIKCFEANYPESLGVVLVHKAPWVFQGIWKIIRGWLDPVVAAKVQFTNNEAEMEAMVPKSRIITELGGAEDYTYKYIEPVAGENDKMKDTTTRDKLMQQRSVIVDEYEKRTLEWINGEGDVEALKKTRHEIALKLRDDYWNLDPYIRARSYYDRIGLINGGNLHFYPQAKATSTSAAAAPIVNTSADDID